MSVATLTCSYWTQAARPSENSIWVGERLRTVLHSEASIGKRPKEIRNVIENAQMVKTLSSRRWVNSQLVFSLVFLDFLCQSEVFLFILILRTLFLVTTSRMPTYRLLVQLLANHTTANASAQTSSFLRPRMFSCLERRLQLRPFLYMQLLIWLYLKVDPICGY